MHNAAATPDITALRKTIESHFPELWPAVSVGLATCATLLLAENANSTALIYVGGPSIYGTPCLISSPGGSTERR